MTHTAEKYNWISSVPEGWKLVKLKYLSSISTGVYDTQDKLEDGTFPFFVRSPHIERIDKYSHDCEAVMTAGDGVGVGKVFHYYNGRFAAHQRVYVFNQFKNNVLGKYIYYSLMSNLKLEVLQGNAKSTVDSLRYPMLSNFPILLPNLSIQTIVVEFLERKISDIDTLIEDKEKLIALLEEKQQAIITEAITKGLDSDVKMKDSGVEWIGEIPEHWITSKIKYLSNHNLIYGANASAELDDENLPRYIRITDIDRNGHLREETFRSLSKDIASKYPLNKGDILFARSGATVGKTYIHQENNISTYAGYLIKFRSDKNKLNPKFLYYFTKSFCYEKWIEANTIQATIENVSAEKYKNMLIPYPPTGEQYAIVKFLESYINDNYTLLKELENQINKLKEYRQSLIYETVTGKIDVQEMLKETDHEEVSSS